MFLILHLNIYTRKKENNKIIFLCKNDAKMSDLQSSKKLQVTEKKVICEDKILKTMCRNSFKMNRFQDI